MFRLFTPDLRVSRVEVISADMLRRWGVDALLLDADCTLKRYNSPDVTPEVAAWLAGLRAAGTGLCLVSNGRGRRIEQFAQALDLPFVAKAMKPLPWGCRAAMRKLNFQQASTAIVGDQIFSDIMAGRLAGLKTILVDPIHPEEERWFTRWKRPPERWVLRRLNSPLPPGDGTCNSPLPSGEGQGVRGTRVRMASRDSRPSP